jgi:dienelactone hydrolase
MAWSVPTRGGVVSQDFPWGAVGTADYRPGDAGRPAVLVLHGFLQTRNFSTVARIANAMADEGFTVLAPTLTLGISDRSQSLSCEAIHTHTVEQGIGEVRRWVEWLAEQGHGTVVPVGHSSGSMILAGYAQEAPHPSVSRVVLVSATPFGANHVDYQREFHAEQARAALADGRSVIGSYALGYCETFISPPETFLSYYRWGPERLLGAIQESRVPIHVIVGGADERIDGGWVAGLRDASRSVDVIEGANHFFDTAYEFDLHDRLMGLVGQDD